MFDQPPSLPMRAAIASLLGGLFGVALILVTHSAQAQTQTQTLESATAVQAGPAAEVGSALERLSGTALRSLRGAEPGLSGSALGSRGLRVNDSGGNEPIGLGVQVRF